MNEDFGKVIERIAQGSAALLSKGEEAAKQSIVLPVLAHLGWNIYDINEVEPEYKISDGRVDYCLRAQNKKAFIEAKRMREDLEGHEKQLLEYAFQEGVEIAVLTNGLVWWFYLPTEKGHWQERKFFTIDFNQQDPATIANHFNEFLNKNGILSGACMENAKKIKQGREKDKAIAKAIPEAWGSIISGPDESFIEIFADKVESICGHRPEAEALANFIKNAPSGLKEPMKPSLLIKPIKKYSQGHQACGDVFDTMKVKIGDEVFSVSPVSGLYDNVLRYLCDSGLINKMAIPFETSSKRYLIAKEPYHQRGNEFRVPIEYSGYYMEAHKDHKNGLNHLVNFLKTNGVGYQIIQ